MSEREIEKYWSQKTQNSTGAKKHKTEKEQMKESGEQHSEKQDSRGQYNKKGK